MNPAVAQLIATLFEVLGPVVAQALEKAIAGDPDPLSGLLTESVLMTLPAPLKSRVALDAANAADAAVTP